MKKTILFIKNLTSRHQVLFSIALLFLSFASFAQLQNNGTIFVKNSSKLFLKTGNYYFGESSTTQTTRNGTLYGKIIFGSGVTTSNSSNSLFINGYGSTVGLDPFTIPVGQGSTLAPVRVDIANSPEDPIVDVAFINTTVPPFSASISSTLQITTEGWYRIIGSTAKITLGYRPATVANFTTTDYIILGRLVSTSKWVEIPSSIDVTNTLYGTPGTLSNTQNGSITSTNEVVLGDYLYFTIGAKGLDCAPVFVGTGVIKRWNGNAWVLDSDGVTATSAPTDNDFAVIADNYPSTADSFSCNTLTVSDGKIVRIGNFKYIDCVNDAVTNGTSKIIVASEANFVQRNDVAQAPTIQLTKLSTDKRRYDYIYFGTPIAGDFLSQMATAKPVSSLLTPTDQTVASLDNYLAWTPNAGGGTSAWGSIAATITGKGFIARIKNQAPFNDATHTEKIKVTFSGVANNGIKTIGVANSTTSPNGSASHNLLANPYPSSIDADKFLISNTLIDGVVYLWTSSTQYNGSGPYIQADYITYTRLGSTATTGNPAGTNSFEGKIASGQGFMVKALGSGDVTFNNCMRVTTDTDLFYKSSSTAVVNRYKINMEGANGVFSQILVGYIPEATLEYDRMYDAGRNSVSTAQLFTFLDNTTRKLAINARPTFVDTDVVAVGITKNNTNNETFTFSIAEKEGVFNSGDATVYMHDKVLDTYHNFNDGSFTFTTSENNISNRFELVYQPSGNLSNPDYSQTKTLVALNDNIFKVTSSHEMAKIAIYDIAGRLIANYDNVNNTTFSSNFNNVQGVYIAKITLADGRIVSEKVLNQ